MSKRKQDYLGLKQSVLIFSDLHNRYVYIPGTTERKSVVKTIKRGRKKGADPNRELMIKFKYDQATMEEENLLHENIKNLIYKVMHKNCVHMEFEDVYHEIWKKIIKSKHTWDENNGTRVSTWIVVVANSVINTLRLGVSKYNSRFCRYDDLTVTNDDESANDMADVVALNNDEDNSFTEDIEFKDNYKNFCERLSEDERKMLYTIVNGNGKISLRSISRETGIKYNDVGEMLNSIKSKFYQVFEERKTKDMYHASKKN